MSWTTWKKLLHPGGQAREGGSEAKHQPHPPPLARGATMPPGDWQESYHPVMLSGAILGRLALDPDTLGRAMEIMEHLESDQYLEFLRAYYRLGRERYGSAWRYADIVTVLLACALLIQPESYLEIGVRRGRSMAMVAATRPRCRIVGFDLWKADYAGMPNPGPDFVRAELDKLGYRGSLELVSGDSHQTLPAYFNAHPDEYFDLITVDGDHSRQGAIQDLREVMPRLKLGGALVFDDICHPAHPYLLPVWQETVAGDPRFTTWQFTDLGYGVALAIRKRA